MTALGQDPAFLALSAELQPECEAADEEELHNFGPPRLQRFLDGNNGSVTDAKAQFLEMLAWRRKERIEARMRSQVLGRSWRDEPLPRVQRLLDLMGVSIGGNTPEGHIIWVQRDGRANFDELMAMPEEELLESMLLMCEHRETFLNALSNERGHLIKVLQVRDLTGLSIAKVVRDTMALHRLSSVLKVVTLAYPETVHKAVLCRLPSSFSMLWALISPLLNARTKSKIIFTSAESFPRELATAGGCNALEALARARGDFDSGDCAELLAGEVAYTTRRAKARQRIAWAFDVSPAGEQVELSVFFCPDCPSPELQEVDNSDEDQSGSFDAPVDGLIWFCFSNEASWMRSKQVANLCIEVASPSEARRSCHERRNSQRRSTNLQKSSLGLSGTSCSDCFAGLFARRRPRSSSSGGDPFGHESPIKDTSQSLRPADGALRPPSPSKGTGSTTLKLDCLDATKICRTSVLYFLGAMLLYFSIFSWSTNGAVAHSF